MHSFLFGHAVNTLQDNAEHQAKWTIWLCAHINLSHSLTQLHPAFVFVPRYISNYLSFQRNTQPTIFVQGNMCDELDAKTAY